MCPKAYTGFAAADKINKHKISKIKQQKRLGL